MERKFLLVRHKLVLNIKRHIFSPDEAQAGLQIDSTGRWVDYEQAAEIIDTLEFKLSELERSRLKS